MSDYERIARIIRYLDEHQTEQPSLETLAGLVGLSPSHFHRLFARWAGMTPKDFLQSLTLAHIRARLRAGESVLHAACESGLSGPGRAHDLCVSLESATPGEIKSGGSGWRVVYGVAASPFGDCLLAQGPRGICHLGFVESAGLAETVAELRDDWPAAEWTRDDRAATELAETIFRPPGGGAHPGLRTLVKGSAFQLKVWRALLRIPQGGLVSYGALAATIGQPTASRAVGSAVGRNPVSWLIPCHRVIRETAVIGHYAYGRLRKQAILAWEWGGTAAPLEAAAVAGGRNPEGCQTVAGG